MWRGDAFFPRMTAAFLVVVTVVVMGLSGVASAQSGTGDKKPLKDYSVGGDIIMNVPPGSHVTLFGGLNASSKCGRGEPDQSETTTTGLNQSFHVALRVFTGIEGACIGHYSRTTYLVDVGDSRNVTANVPFVQTEFGRLGGDGEFELQCPAADEINVLVCRSLNSRTIELTRPEPAVLHCDGNLEVGNKVTLRDTRICDVSGWPPPPLKISGLGTDGKVAGMTIGRSASDRSKIVLNGKPTGPVQFYDLSITADAPPYPSRNIRIAKCDIGGREDTDNCP